VQRATRSLVILVFLAGCGVPGLVWKQADIGGPVVGALNTRDDRPLVQERCGTPPFMAPHGTTCAYAFVDSNGRRVDIDDVRSRIDSMAEKLPPLKPWINKDRDHQVDRRFPFSMHLLTISPAIVLVVPVLPPNRPATCGELYRSGCIQSYSFLGQSYWFRGDPSVQEGSFWFNADVGGSMMPVDVHGETFTIASGTATLRLVRSANVWVVHRDQ
jgi:hypothetical protein